MKIKNNISLKGIKDNRDEYKLKLKRIKRDLNKIAFNIKKNYFAGDDLVQI